MFRKSPDDRLPRENGDQSATTDVAKRYELARLSTLLLLVGLACFFLLTPLLIRSDSFDLLALRLGMTQDLPLLPIILAAALLTPAATQMQLPLWLGDRRLLLAAIPALILIGFVGRTLIFQGYDLSRDEQMALFDQGIFSNGANKWPIAQEWRFLVEALNLRFLWTIDNNQYWVSGYLPVHAAFRALLGTVLSPDFASPLMAALGAVSIWNIARRLWPQSAEMPAIALLLFVTSSQILIMSMTPFAMSMHLGLNLLWLWLFLTDKPLTHVGAIVVGFLATGIHQPLFHPFFVMPFLLFLVEKRRWRLLTIYVVAYAAIGLFWIAEPFWLTSSGSGIPAPVNCSIGEQCEGQTYLDLFFSMATGFDLTHAFLTSANLLRFASWQHPLVIPLALMGGMACWRSNGFVRALMLSIILPIIVIAVIIPWQGHGWGYRYLHPVLGNVILLACFGWRRLADNRLNMARPLAITTGLAVILLAVHSAMAAHLVAPFAEAHADLASIDADAVIVDTELTPFGQDLVFNRYDLANRPKLLIADMIVPDQLAQLCRNSTIAFVDAPRFAALNTLFGLPVPQRASPEAQELRRQSVAANCRILRRADPIKAP